MQQTVRTSWWFEQFKYRTLGWWRVWSCQEEEWSEAKRISRGAAAVTAAAQGGGDGALTSELFMWRLWGKWRDEEQCVWTRVLWAQRGDFLIKDRQNIGCWRKKKTRQKYNQPPKHAKQSERGRLIFQLSALQAAVYRTTNTKLHILFSHWRLFYSWKPTWEFKSSQTHWNDGGTWITSR